MKGRIVLVAFRLASAVASASKPIKFFGLPYVIFYRLVFEWFLGVEIPWKTTIGRRLRLYHGPGLVIHPGTVIGDYCVLRHNTTIGISKTGDVSSKSPVIGNFVDIGANVVIIGNISIGLHSIIGAGSAVVKSIPPYSIVVGNPGRVIKKVKEIAHEA